MPEEKVQVMERKVGHLRYILAGGFQCVGSEWVQGILEVLLPGTEGKL